jgi:hypothetical protein
MEYSTSVGSEQILSQDGVGGEPIKAGNRDIGAFRLLLLIVNLQVKKSRAS